jgi:hypothetical protein
MTLVVGEVVGGNVGIVPVGKQSAHAVVNPTFSRRAPRGGSRIGEQLMGERLRGFAPVNHTA